MRRVDTHRSVTERTVVQRLTGRTAGTSRPDTAAGSHVFRQLRRTSSSVEGCATPELEAKNVDMV